MKIKLDDKHYLNGDGLCYWITCEYTNKKGTVAERRVSGYCQTFERAVNSLIEKRICESDINTLQELKNAQNDLKTLLKGWDVQLKRLEVIK